MVAKNAILLVDFTNQLKQEGKKTYDALVMAGKMRLRPILMTTIAMVIGLLPIALAKGAGAEWKNGLAWALMGGLTSSMIFTLVLVPVVYYIVDLILAKFKRTKSVPTPTTDSFNGAERLDTPKGSGEEEKEDEGNLVLST